tara:strand:+ start:116 stop:1042 length:927 start_codon:yes stop_codon:yes gene_type:complete
MNVDINQLKNIYKENILSVQEKYLLQQSNFLSTVYGRYLNDLDSANIVLYFAKNLHLKILRKRENQINYEISLESFWNNHKNIDQENLKIINVSNETGLPKETARRKILNLIEEKILKKINNKISWEPKEKDKLSFNKIIETEIEYMTKIASTIIKHLKIDVSNQQILSDIKKNFSFFWFHFLSSQLKCMKIWQAQLKDLELLLIIVECAIQSNRYLTRTHNKKIDKNISAMSISTVTGIPRATCIRKLDKLVDMKIVKKDQMSKRYYLDIKNDEFNKNAISKTLNEVCSFYDILIRTLTRDLKVYKS